MAISFHTLSQALCRWFLSFCYICASTKSYNHYHFVHSNVVPSSQPTSPYHYKNGSSNHDDFRNVNSFEKKLKKKKLRLKRRKKSNIIILRANKLIVNQKSSSPKSKEKNDDKFINKSSSFIRNKYDNTTNFVKESKTQREVLYDCNNQDSNIKISTSRNQKEAVASSSHRNYKFNRFFDVVNHENNYNPYSKLSSLLLKQELPKMYQNMQQSIELDKKLINEERPSRNFQPKRRTKTITRTKIKHPKVHSTILSSLDLLHDSDVSDKYNSVDERKNMEEKNSQYSLDIKRDLNDEEFETLLKDLLHDETATDDDIYYDEEIWDSKDLVDEEITEYEYSYDSYDIEELILKSDGGMNGEKDYYEGERVYDDDDYDMAVLPSKIESDDGYSSLGVPEYSEIYDNEEIKNSILHDNFYYDESYEDYYEYDEDNYNEGYGIQHDINIEDMKCIDSNSEIHHKTNCYSSKKYDRIKNHGQYDQLNNDIMGYPVPAPHNYIEDQNGEEYFEAGELFDKYDYQTAVCHYNKEDVNAIYFEDGNNDYDDQEVEEILDEEEILLLKEASNFGLNPEREDEEDVFEKKIHNNPFLRLVKKRSSSLERNILEPKDKKIHDDGKTSSKISSNHINLENVNSNDNDGHNDQNININIYHKTLGSSVSGDQNKNITDAVKEGLKNYPYNKKENIPNLDDKEEDNFEPTSTEKKEEKKSFLMTSLLFVGKKLKENIYSKNEPKNINNVHDENLLSSNNCTLIELELEEEETVEPQKNLNNFISDSKTKIKLTSTGESEVSITLGDFVVKNFENKSMSRDEISGIDDEILKEETNIVPPPPPPLSAASRDQIPLESPPPPPPPLSDVFANDDKTPQQPYCETKGNHRNPQWQESNMNCSYKNDKSLCGNKINSQNINDLVLGNNSVPPPPPPPPASQLF